MTEFILYGILWTLALYGLIEIIKNIYYVYTYTNLKSDGIYLIVAVKNEEERIEACMRSMMFKYLYGKEDMIKDVILADLSSTDNTMQIIEKLGKDYHCIKVTNWKDCVELMNSVDSVKNVEIEKHS